MQPHPTLHQLTTTTVLLNLCRHPVRGQSKEEYLEQQCQEILGRDEMVRNGSRWRRRIKWDSAKLHRVLADLRTMQKEGKFVRYPGGYAECLWKIFS